MEEALTAPVPPAGSDLLSVWGIPVSFDGSSALRWDTPTPAWFPGTRAMDEGVRVDATEFAALVEAARARK